MPKKLLNNKQEVLKFQRYIFCEFSLGLTSNKIACTYGTHQLLELRKYTYMILLLFMCSCLELYKIANRFIKFCQPTKLIILNLE
jgi:hypothetical protein